MTEWVSTWVPSPLFVPCMSSVICSFRHRRHIPTDTNTHWTELIYGFWPHQFFYFSLSRKTNYVLHYQSVWEQSAAALKGFHGLQRLPRLFGQLVFSACLFIFGVPSWFTFLFIFYGKRSARASPAAHLENSQHFQINRGVWRFAILFSFLSRIYFFFFHLSKHLLKQLTQEGQP